MNKPDKIEGELASFYDNTKAVDQTPGISAIPIDNNTSSVGMRWRGINTTKDIGNSKRGTIFSETLQDGDFRYDPLDRKIYCYGVEYNNFSLIEDWGVSQRGWTKREYARYNGFLYECIQDADNTKTPGDPSGNGYRKPVIYLAAKLPYDNSSITMIDGFNGVVIGTAREIAFVYTSYTANDDFGLITALPLNPTIPQDGYYLINTRETRGLRDGGSDVMSRLIVDDGLSFTTLSESYRYTPIISATASSSGGITTTVTVDQGIITLDTTDNVWMGYLKKGHIIRVEARAAGDTLSITSDYLQITRLF